MQKEPRVYPLFAVCGLNCGLCPRFHTDGKSRCPGCGGTGFYEKHPSCGIISCAGRHGVDYCFQCEEYPCSRYAAPHEDDSFITYQNVQRDFARAKEQGLEVYRRQLDEKVQMLSLLLADYNDGRRKNFYCLAVNLLKLEDLRQALAQARQNPADADLPPKERAARMVAVLEEAAQARGIDLRLRKKK